MAFLKQIKSLKDFNDLLELKKDSLTVVDFHASWCAPCHQIAPVFEQLSQRFLNATFAKVDIVAVQDVAQKYKVSAIPTFLFLKNKQVVDQLRGANAVELEALVQRHAGSPPGISGGSQEEVGADVSLLEFIDTSQVNCLNEASDHSLKSILASKERNTSLDNFLLSDADEQLLLNITFNQTVRVRSVLFHTRDPSQGPKALKIIINNPSLGFDDFENESTLTQALVLSEEDVRDGKRINLRFVRFQSVNILSVFVGSNHGDADETRIDAIDVFGVPVQTTKDLSGLKKRDE